MSEPILEYIKQMRSLVEEALLQAFPVTWEIPGALREAMNYSLMAGGKRLRPILMLAAAEAAGCPPEPVVPAACAVELIHTYSLIHDDLPAMDNDDYRRGKPTNHKVFGEAMAILAGDGLLTHAFYCLVQCTRKSEIPAGLVLDLVEELSVRAGAKGMVGGQAADMEGEQGITGLSQLEYIHRHKTGDLIVFSLKAGGRIAGAADGQLRALEEFGRCIGLAFQIQDDVLDLIGDEQKLGKKRGADEAMHKVTYPYLLGLEACLRKIEELTEQGKDAIVRAGFARPGRLLELADFLMKRDH